MPNAFVTVDTSKWREAVRYVFRNTEKTVPDIVNRSALATIIGGQGVEGVMRKTKKALASAIRAVPIKTIAGVVMNRNRGTKLNRSQINELIGKEYKRRLAAIGYTAYVGWNNAAIAFGGRGVGHRAGGKGWASDGYGIKATTGNAVAEMVNAAPAAAVIGQQALQDSLNEVADDMIEHVRQEMQRTFDYVKPHGT